MGYNAAPLERLIEEFAKLPGIGRKGATRLAYGLPVGSNLEYADEVTLGRSLANRGEL